MLVIARDLVDESCIATASARKEVDLSYYDVKFNGS